MKIHVENLGKIQYADFDMGKLTVLSGMNNTGKTYVTYAIYGFLHYWHNFFDIPINTDIINILNKTGSFCLPLNQYIIDSNEIINQACNEYSRQLASVFATQKSKFTNSIFKITVLPDEIIIKKQNYKFGLNTSSAGTGLTLYKDANDNDLNITLFYADDETVRIPDGTLLQAISIAIKNIVFNTILPHTFLASTERTGAAIFRSELNVARNKIFTTLNNKDTVIDPIKLLDTIKSEYAWPVDHNVNFVSNLEIISKKESNLFKNNSILANSFASILGGEFKISDKNELFFITNNKRNENIQLTMDESSSSVRSLLDIGFYLKHQMQPDDLLMIDEPELNLHPVNQRKIARLLVILVNCGIKVFITTHSDYLLRELGNLILLNDPNPNIQNIVVKEGYDKKELLNVSDIKIYIAQEQMVKLPDNKRRKKINTLSPVMVDNERGIYFSSFDEVINDMNRIYDNIMYGE